jgi:hypothetical protein
MAGFSFLPTIQNTSSSYTKNPWDPAQSALTQALSGAQNAYDTTYNGNLVAGMDPNVTAGQNQALGIAGQGATTDAAQTGMAGVNGILQQGGIGAPMQYGIDTMKGAVGNLGGIASGQYLDNNPYLDQIIKSTNENATNGVNAQFSKAGRYGSGAYAGALGKELAANETNARYQNFVNMLNAQLQANQQIGGLASGVAGIGQQGIGNVMAGGNALQSYIDPLYSDASKQSEIGGQRMDYEQAKIDAANQAPWTKAMNLANIATGIGSMGGTGTENSQSIGIGPVQQQQSPSAMQTVAGAGLGLLGAGGMAGGFGKLFKF